MKYLILLASFSKHINSKYHNFQTIIAVPASWFINPKQIQELCTSVVVVTVIKPKVFFRYLIKFIILLRLIINVVSGKYTNNIMFSKIRVF